MLQHGPRDSGYLNDSCEQFHESRNFKTIVGPNSRIVVSAHVIGFRSFIVTKERLKA
jgi:hypothetical protein